MNKIRVPPFEFNQNYWNIKFESILINISQVALQAYLSLWKQDKSDSDVKYDPIDNLGIMLFSFFNYPTKHEQSLTDNE